jgi:hypothetical protein
MIKGRVPNQLITRLLVPVFGYRFVGPCIGSVVDADAASDIGVKVFDLEVVGGPTLDEHRRQSEITSDWRLKPAGALVKVGSLGGIDDAPSGNALQLTIRKHDGRHIATAALKDVCDGGEVAELVQKMMAGRAGQFASLSILLPSERYPFSGNVTE